jgi:transposase
MLSGGSGVSNRRLIAMSERLRRKRMLSAQEKFQIWLQLLTGELSQSAAAEKYGIDPTTIMRIRKVAREGALAALAASKPGRRNDLDGAELAAAKAEIARLEETVKEQAIELVLLRGGQRSGW